MKLQSPMKFRLIHKKLGIKSIDVFSEFECPNNIKDIYCVKDVGFLCLCENSLILVTSEERRTILSLDNPMSICNGQKDSVYILYNGGIKNVNYKDDFYPTDILSISLRHAIFGQLVKTGIYGMSIDAYEEVIGICVSPIHKFYKIRKTSIEKEYGTGTPEYGLSNDLTCCSLYNPQGILVYDSNTIFVSDTSNGCIRSFGKSHNIITGNPLTSDIAPTKLLMDRKKDVLYYLSKNYLRSISINENRDAVLYESNHIISIGLAHDGKIYILEALEGLEGDYA